MWAPNVWNLVSGEEARIALHVLDKNGDPLNISGATAIKLRIKNADGSYLERQADVGMVFGRPLAPLNIYGFSFTCEEVAAMPVKAKQPVIVKILYGDDKVFSYVIPSGLTIENVQI